MGSLPTFGAFVIRSQEKDGRTCINGLPVASPSKQMLGRFPRLQSLCHPNLGQYMHFYETVKARDLVILVQEHHPTTLLDLLKAGMLPDQNKSMMFEEIISAMDYLHDRGVYHGNLNVRSIHQTEKDEKVTVKLSAYGLPFLTNFGKDSASSMDHSVFTAPETVLNYFEDLTDPTTCDSDVWDLGIVLLQIYWGVVLEDVVTEEEYINIIFETFGGAERGKHSFMEKIEKLLIAKDCMPNYTNRSWMEWIIESCLQWVNRPTIFEIAVHMQTHIIPRSTFKYQLKSVDQMRAKLEKELAKNTHGFEKLALENIFYLWKTCGSSPEMILLKKGVIRNHPPICGYPTVRFDDFQEADTDEETQSTFKSGVFELPNKRTISRMEDGRRIDSKSFYPLYLLDEDEDFSNILYEESRNMLHTAHLLDAAAVHGLKEVVPLLASKGIVSTQRSEVWRALLGITEAKSRAFRNLDVLAAHSSDRQLEVDIPRCHQYDSFMTTPAIQESLRKVLKGWQIVTESQNYVYWQGCDSLATPFLLTNMSEPHAAFACFNEFTYRYCHKFYLKDNSEVIKEYLGIFYHLVAYTDPVLYKHLKLNGFDAELFAIPWFLTCFAHELPLSKLFRLWDETMMHGNSFPLMIALAMLNRLRDKLLSVNFNEMIIIIHDQPDLSIEDVIAEARQFEEIIPPSCAFRIHASPWKPDFLDEIYCLPNSMKGLSLTQLGVIQCPRMSTEEFLWRLERKMIFVIDTRSVQEFNSEHFKDSFNHPDSLTADIEWLRFIPKIVTSKDPKCIIYAKNDMGVARDLAASYVMKGVPYICLLHEPYESITKNPELVEKQ